MNCRLTHLYYIVCLLTLFAVVSCSDDDDVAASYRTDYADMTTDAEGNAVQLLLDDGSVLNILNAYATGRVSQNFRVYAASEQMEAGVRLINFSNVLTDVPHKFDEEKVKTDPVDLIAVWRGGRYVNFRLGLKTGASAKKHAFSVVDDGITIDDDGKKSLHIRLYHSQNDDDMSYTRTAAFSCSLDNQKSVLNAGDRVEVKVNTFSGLKTITLDF